jgi:hypothetical protein
MPCNSDYMEADGREIALSQVACLLDEIDGKGPINPSHWRGYHPRVYNRRADGDELVAELCSKLQGKDIAKCSLEMQIWWRDHQNADRERIQRELQEAENKKARKDAIAKLTPHERKLLGLD